MYEGLLRRWDLPEAEAGSLSPLEAVVRARELDSDFFDLSLARLAPFTKLPGVREAAEVTARHIGQFGIVVVGDYDCDGLTSVAQVSRFFSALSVPHKIVTPEREEGYGIPARVFEEADEATGLLLALDCGAMDTEIVREARARGMEVVVIDHHEVGPGAAEPTVLLNPKAAPGVEFREFCASGLTLLFLAALRKVLDVRVPLNGAYRALAGIGTIADMVPLVGPNRVLAASGLEALNAGALPSMRVLAETAGLGDRELTARNLAFQLAPRLNAGKRGLVSSKVPLCLLLTEDVESEAPLLSGRLHAAVDKRRALEDAVLRDIAAKYHSTPHGRALVMAGEGWHPGVLGVAAGKVIQNEIHYGPVCLLAYDKQTGLLSGSARTVPGVDLHDLLSRCAGCLERWGGHVQAAGLSLHPSKLDAFRLEVEEILAGYPEETFTPFGTVDAILNLRKVAKHHVDELARLEPHGQGNPRPLFAARIFGSPRVRYFGELAEHVEITWANGRAVWWGGAGIVREIGDVKAGTICVGRLGWSSYNNAAEIVVCDLIVSA